MGLQKIGTQDSIHLCGTLVKLGNNCPKANRWLSGILEVEDTEPDQFNYTKRVKVRYSIKGTGSIYLTVGDIVECDVDPNCQFFNGVPQYCVSNGCLITPVATTEDAVVRYLSGPAFKGVGEKTATKLYSWYKEATLPVVMSKTFEDRLKLDNHSLPQNVIDSLRDGLTSSSALRALTSMFPSLPVFAAARILQTDEHFNIDIFRDAVTNNPYAVLYERYNVSLRDTDRVALQDCHKSVTADERFVCMLRLAVKKFCSELHATYVRVEDRENREDQSEWGLFFGFFKEVLSRMFDPNLPKDFKAPALRKWLVGFYNRGKPVKGLIVEGGGVNTSYPFGQFPRINAFGEEEYALYLEELYEAEQTIAEIVAEGSTYPHKDIRASDFPMCYKYSAFHMPEGIRNRLSHCPLDSTQQKAVQMPWKYRLSFITGGPGRGKTSCLASMIYAWKRLKWGEVVLLTPTGKALSRLRQQTDYADASTIDRFLLANQHANLNEDQILTPLKHKVRKGEFTLIVVDEASMLDFVKASRLLSFVRGCTVVFVGDKNQLSPIDPGPFLKECLESHLVHVTELNKNYRSDHCDWIKNMDVILDPKAALRDLKTTADFLIFPWDDNQLHSEEYLKNIQDYIANTYADDVEQDDYSNVMVLSPYKVESKALSTANLNVLLQGRMNPRARRVVEKTVHTHNVAAMRQFGNYDGGLYIDTRGAECVSRDAKGNDVCLTDMSDVPIRVGDRVINMKNLPDMPILLFKNNSGQMADLLDTDRPDFAIDDLHVGISNGDIGTVRQFYLPHGHHHYQMLVELEGEPITVPVGVMGKPCSFSRFVLVDIDEKTGRKFTDWNLAYALSIHKAQGSEAKHIIIVAPENTYPGFITRNMFYTAVTRSSQSVTIIGSRQTCYQFMDRFYQYYNVRLADMLNGTVDSIVKRYTLRQNVV